jgi:hypothetical protein
MRTKNKILFLIIAICLFVFSPSQASITGTRMIANQLVTAMSEVESVFFMCCVFQDMLDEAIELQGKAYFKFGKIDKIELRQQLLELDSRFNTFLNNITQKQWCELNAIVKESLIKLRTMLEVLQALDVEFEAYCEQNSTKNAHKAERHVEKIERQLYKIIKVLVKHFKRLQHGSCEYSDVYELTAFVAKTKTTRRGIHAKMGKHLDRIQEAVVRLTELTSVDEQGQLKCDCNIWCELADWVHAMEEIIGEMFHDLNGAEVVLNAKCPSVGSGDEYASMSFEETIEEWAQATRSLQN